MEGDEALFIFILLFSLFNLAISTVCLITIVLYYRVKYTLVQKV